MDGTFVLSALMTTFPDFPASVLKRPEVARVVIVPAKAERRCRIVHLCKWHMVPKSRFARSMEAEGKTDEQIDQFCSRHLNEDAAIVESSLLTTVPCRWSGLPCLRIRVRNSLRRS